MQKNRLIEMVLLSTHNICFGWEIRNISFWVHTPGRVGSCQDLNRINTHKNTPKPTKTLAWNTVYETIFTFSKQSLNESIDFCNRSLPPEWHKFDLQLASSLDHAIGFEHRIHSPEVTLVLWLTASHTWVARAKQALVCSIGCPSSHWLFRFSVLHSNKTVNTNTYLIQNCFFLNYK